MDMWNLAFVIVGSMLLPVVAALWALALDDFLGEGREGAMAAAVGSILACLALAYGGLGLKASRRGSWIVRVVTPFAVVSVGVFLWMIR